MNARASAYCAAVIIVACALLPFQDWQALWLMPTPHVWGLVFLIALAILSEALSFTTTLGRHQAASTIVFLPLFACVLLFPPPAAFFAMALTSAMTQFFIHKRTLLKGAFNASQTTISIFVGNTAFTALGGVHSVPLTLDFSVHAVVVLGALAFAFFFTNQVLVSIAIALVNGDRFGTVFNRVIATSGGNFLYDILASPIAVVIAILYSYFEIWGIIIGVVPLLIIRMSYAAIHKLQQANKDLLTVLIKTIETRDPYTSGHSIRVSILARAIAEDMNLSVAVVDRIEMAALVHDIGKIDAVYTSIIRKEGTLSESERNIIITHAAKGADFLTTLSSFRDDVIEGVRHHHERYDGSGYPDGMSGERIPLAARIIMLCDSIDAMLSDRPYRKALTVPDVRLELLRCAGTQFDPRIVDIILNRNTLERAAALVRPEQNKPTPLLAVSA